MDNKNDTTMCTCECHQPGTAVRHCIPCCDQCYEKYTPEMWEAAHDYNRIVQQMKIKLKESK